MTLMIGELKLMKSEGLLFNTSYTLYYRLLHGTPVTLSSSNDVSTVTDSFDQLNISGVDQINTVPVNTPYYHNNGDALCYPSYYISVLPANELIINEASSDSREIELMESYYKENPQWQEERVLVGGGGGGGEGYERVTDVHRRFLKFKEEMSKCPQQLIRYSFIFDGVCDLFYAALFAELNACTIGINVVVSPCHYKTLLRFLLHAVNVGAHLYLNCSCCHRSYTCFRRV